jgi:PAS domain S-box-containing protein
LRVLDAECAEIAAWAKPGEGNKVLAGDLSKLLDGTADAAFAVNDQGLICAWNRAAEKFLGYPASEVLDKPCAQLFQGRSTLGAQICTEPCSVIDCALLHREIPNYDMEVKVRSGRRVWVNVSILVFRDERTNRHLVAHLIRDISRKKVSEELTRKLVQIAQQVSNLSEEEEAALPPVLPLTEQERRVLRVLAEGKSPSTLARELRISPRTLRNHLHHINQKLHTHNRLEAVIQATRRGII